MAEKLTCVKSTWYITTCNIANIFSVYRDMLIEKVKNLLYIEGLKFFVDILGRNWVKLWRDILGRNI